MNWSPSPAKNLLLAGPPGCGKTTVVRRVVQRLSHLRLAGFYTQEIRDHDRRVGFEAVGLRGGSVVLAHADFRGLRRVGRYGVDVAGLESLIKTELQRPAADVDLYVIDEIGKMECLSGVFVDAARLALDSPAPILATVPAEGGGFARQVTTRPDVEIELVSPKTRDELPDAIVRRFLRQAPSPSVR
jgi:nucleoside-triphosphatase